MCNRFQGVVGSRQRLNNSSRCQGTGHEKGIYRIPLLPTSFRRSFFCGLQNINNVLWNMLRLYMDSIWNIWAGVGVVQGIPDTSEVWLIWVIVHRPAPTRNPHIYRICKAQMQQSIVSTKKCSMKIQGRIWNFKFEYSKIPSKKHKHNIWKEMTENL